MNLGRTTFIANTLICPKIHSDIIITFTTEEHYTIRILKLTFTPIVFLQVSDQFNVFFKPKNASQNNVKNTDPPSMGQIENVRTSSHATDFVLHSQRPRRLVGLSSCLLENQLREFISHRVHTLVGTFFLHKQLISGKRERLS